MNKKKLAFEIERLWKAINGEDFEMWELKGLRENSFIIEGMVARLNGLDSYTQSLKDKQENNRRSLQSNSEKSLNLMRDGIDKLDKTQDERWEALKTYLKVKEITVKSIEEKKEFIIAGRAFGLSEDEIIYTKKLVDVKTPKSSNKAKKTKKKKNGK